MPYLVGCVRVKPLKYLEDKALRDYTKHLDLNVCYVFLAGTSESSIPMKRTRLDPIDRKILIALQEDGRITNVDLAKKAGISAPPCLRRVRALEEAGYIDSYHATLNAQKLGFGITVFAHVSLQSHNDVDVKKMESQLALWPQVREAHLLTGETDLLLKIVAPDWEAYQQFLTTELQVTPNVESVRSSIAIRASKMAPGVPLEDTEDKADAA